MSRRARARMDKRAEAQRLAELFTQGFPLSDDDDDESNDDPADWDGHGEDPHGRTPIGPVDVQAPRNF